MKASAINYIVDAGPLVASLNLRDQWHEWAVNVMSVLDEPAVVSELVLAEACHLLKGHRSALLQLIDAVRNGSLLPSSPWLHAIRVDELLRKFPAMDAGDASTVVLSEQWPKARIITTDVRDFTVYRRFRNESLPLIHP